MPSYLSGISNGSFLFKSCDERGVQESAFQDYFKAIVGSGDYAKMFYRKY